MAISRRSTFFEALALVTLSIILILCFVALVPLVFKGIHEVYHLFPETPSNRYRTFAALSGTIVAVFGVGVAVLTFILNARSSRRSLTKQHTITILLESRLSDTFQRHNELRKRHYPPGQDITPRDFTPTTNAPLRRPTQPTAPDGDQKRSFRSSITTNSSPPASRRAILTKPCCVKRSAATCAASWMMPA